MSELINVEIWSSNDSLPPKQFDHLLEAEVYTRENIKANWYARIFTDSVEIYYAALENKTDKNDLFIGADISQTGAYCLAIKLKKEAEKKITLCKHCGRIQALHMHPDDACPDGRNTFVPTLPWEYLTEENLIELVKHMWIYSGYPQNGYAKMSLEQKALYHHCIDTEE